MSTDANAAVRSRIIVVMGVAASGKTTLASELAGRFGWQHLDADDFHPQSNVDKMSAGIALTDTDRLPWLARIRDELDSVVRAGDSVVLACSALKKSYRDILRGSVAPVRFVYLQATRPQLLARVSARGDHFFPPELLDSQFEALEEPSHDERPITLAVDRPAETLADIVEAEIAR